MKTIIETLREIRIRPTLMWSRTETEGDVVTSRDGRSYAVAVDGSLRTGHVRPRNGKKARRERIAMRRLDREYGWVAADPEPEVAS